MAGSDQLLGDGLKTMEGELAPDLGLFIRDVTAGWSRFSIIE